MADETPELTPAEKAAAKAAEKAAKAKELQGLLDQFATIHDHGERCKFYFANPRLKEVYSEGNFNG